MSTNYPARNIRIRWILAISNLLMLGLLIWALTKKEVNNNACETCFSNAACEEPGIRRLPLRFATELIRNYRENQWSTINKYCSTINENENIEVVDPRSVWFSLDSIKRFIHQIETATCGNCGNDNTLGIRIYFGAYNNAADEYAVREEYRGKHTLMMIPTIQQGKSGDHIDFDPMRMNDDCTPKPFGLDILVLTPEADMESQNHGELIPPPYDCVTYYGAEFMKFVDKQEHENCVPTGRNQVIQNK